jgi:hypothetical protein
MSSICDKTGHSYGDSGKCIVCRAMRSDEVLSDTEEEIEELKAQLVAKTKEAAELRTVVADLCTDNVNPVQSTEEKLDWMTRWLHPIVMRARAALAKYPDQAHEPLPEDSHDHEE